jgi:hypothetical protein
MLEFNIRPDTLTPFGGTGKGGAAQGAEGIQKNMEALAQYIQTKWPGAIEEAAKTTAGQLSTLEGNIETLAESVGRNLLPEINKGMHALSGMVEKFNNLDDQTKADIVTMLKWGTVGALLVSGGLKLAATMATLRIAMATASIARAQTIASQKAETAAVQESVVAYNEKAAAYIRAAGAGANMTAAERAAAAAGAGRGGLWSKGSPLRIGLGVAGLGLMGYGFYQGYRGGQATANQSLADATVKNAGFWGGAGMTSLGAMVAAKSLLNTDLKTTLIIGVAAGIVYGFSRVAGRWNANYSPEGIKDQIEAAITGTRPKSRLDEAVLAGMQKSLDRFAQVPEAMGKVFERMASGIAETAGTKYGELIRRQWDDIPADVRAANPKAFNPFAPGYVDILATLRGTQDQGLFGATMGRIAGGVPQSGRLGAMAKQYDVMMQEGQKTLHAMAMMDWQLQQNGQRKSSVDYAEAAQKAMATLEDATRGFATGLQDAATKIREAKLDQLDRDLKAIGDTLSAVEAGLIGEGIKGSVRARRDRLLQQRANLERQMGNDLDAAETERQMGLTRLREAKSDQQDYLDKIRDQLAATLGEFDVGRDFGKLSKSQQAAMIRSAPGWFGSGASPLPTTAEVLAKYDELITALKNAGEEKESDQARLDKVRWQMGLLSDNEKAKPNIAREILSTGGVSGLAEAGISQVVSGGYWGRRQNGVFGPYALSGAAASRIRASMSAENERHIKMDIYVHPDAGTADDIANAAATKVVRQLPRAFRGVTDSLQMLP